MNGKVVSFAGHRVIPNVLSLRNKLKEIIENLIEKGYTIFLNGSIGNFDNLCASILFQLKRKYPKIKIYRIVAYKNKILNKGNYDDVIYPDIKSSNLSFRVRERNRWIVKNSDILICYIRNTKNSGAYNTVLYAKMLNKEIIYI